MTVETKWGLRLTSEELNERAQKFDTRAETLASWAKSRLSKKGITIRDIEFKHAACIDCPIESPYECSDCRIDANMSAALSRPAIIITIEEAE